MENLPPKRPASQTIDPLYEAVLYDQDFLQKLQPLWNAMHTKLIEMANAGAFVCDTDDNDCAFYSDDEEIGGICEWRISKDGKTLGVRLIYDDGGFYRDEPDWYVCPVEWLFMPQDDYMPLMELRNAEIDERRSRQAEDLEREERRKLFLKLKAEFEPEETHGN